MKLTDKSLTVDILYRDMPKGFDMDIIKALEENGCTDSSDYFLAVLVEGSDGYLWLEIVPRPPYVAYDEDDELDEGKGAVRVTTTEDVSAWDLTIDKWRLVNKLHERFELDESVEGTNANFCALCVEYLWDDCNGCPIARRTERGFCNDTPYREYKLGGHTPERYAQITKEYCEWLEDTQEMEAMRL